MIGIEERGKTDRKHGRRNHETQKRTGAIGGVRRAAAENGGGAGVGGAFCKTNEGKVKKYRVRFIKGISWAADSVRIFALSRQWRKMLTSCPDLFSLSVIVHGNE